MVTMAMLLLLELLKSYFYHFLVFLAYEQLFLLKIEFDEMLNLSASLEDHHLRYHVLMLLSLIFSGIKMLGVCMK